MTELNGERRFHQFTFPVCGILAPKISAELGDDLFSCRAVCFCVRCGKEESCEATIPRRELMGMTGQQAMMVRTGCIGQLTQMLWNLQMATIDHPPCVPSEEGAKRLGALFVGVVAADAERA